MSSAVPPRKDGAGCLPLFLELLDSPGRLRGIFTHVGPRVQPLAVVAAEEVVGSGDVAVEGHRHVEH